MHAACACELEKYPAVIRAAHQRRAHGHCQATASALLVNAPVHRPATTRAWCAFFVFVRQQCWSACQCLRGSLVRGPSTQCSAFVNLSICERPLLPLPHVPVRAAGVELLRRGSTAVVHNSCNWRDVVMYCLRSFVVNASLIHQKFFCSAPHELLTPPTLEGKSRTSRPTRRTSGQAPRGSDATSSELIQRRAYMQSTQR